MGATESEMRYRVKVPDFEDFRASIPCRAGCPLGTDTVEYVSAIAEGDTRRAYLIARRTNPLVSVCGRVCRAPCEDACRLREAGGAVSLRALKRFVCDRHGAEPAPQVRSESGDRAVRVAVVGSGPAGLAAAHDLAWLGYRVTIFEADAEAGGTLRLGIPEFRLPADVVRREIRAILAMGVDLELESPIGPERSLDDLTREGYRAFFLGIGLQAPRSLNIDGARLGGVYDGIVYLRLHESIPMGSRCVVVGGGGVAIDCAQWALRRGARDVTVACLESWEEMPAPAMERQDAWEEGIRFRPSLGPKRFLGREGRVVGVEFLEVESLLDGEGRFRPKLRPGTETTLDAETVIVAVGQSPCPETFAGLRGIETTPRGGIRVGRDLSTSVAGVFAGGDILTETQSVVAAIADGRRAARSIHEYLSGRTLRFRTKRFLQPRPPTSGARRSERIGAARPPRRLPRQRIADCEGIELPYEEAQARGEAARCRQCHLQTVLDGSRCILCGTCVDTCVHDSYKMVRLDEIEGDASVERLAGGLGRDAKRARPRTAILKDEVRCVRCGACARRCPTGALTLAAFHSEERWEDEADARRHLEA